MAIEIIGSPSGIKAEVDATPKALRAILYKANGDALFPATSGEYMVRIDVVPTTLTAGTAYQTFRNGGTRSVYIDFVALFGTFAGTAAATRSVYEIVKLLSGTPAAGTSISGEKLDTGDASASMSDIRTAPGGVTMTGVTASANPFALVPVLNQLTAPSITQLQLPEPIVLAVGEGLAIRANSAIVLGSALHGTLSWTER